MNEQISSLLRRKEVIPATVGIVAFIGGAGLGYILGKRRGDVYEVKIDEGDLTGMSIAIRETEDGLEWTNEPMVTVKGEFFPYPVVTNPESVIRIVPPIDEPDTSITVVAEEDDDWDWEAEKSTRTPTEPYIIHRDEFFADDMGYSQSQLDYYQGDDILTDEMSKPIYGHSAMVGPLRFGHGSGDPTVVYIRNELLEHEYEVVLSYGRYEEEVLGLSIDEEYSAQDLKHSKVQRFRMD